MKVALTRNNKLSYHDVVKTARGTFIGFYAIVIETSDISRMNELDELEINYWKRSFGKGVVNQNNLDSRKIKDLI